MLELRVRQGLAAAAALLLVAGICAGVLMQSGPSGEGGSGYAVAAPASGTVAARPAPAPKPEPAADVPSLIATLSAATSYSDSPGGPSVGRLPATNPFGQVEVLAIVGSPTPSGWAKVELPVRPNGSEGWIRMAGVTLTGTTYRVAVNIEARSLTVTKGGSVVLTTPVAVGAPDTPTPAGHTYLWELIRPDDPTGAYGPYIFGLGWFSDAYAVFNGGDAQIGIHGQDEPGSIGEAVSHGCVRLPNALITRLAGMLPLGTPVTIS